MKRKMKRKTKRKRRRRKEEEEEEENEQPLSLEWPGDQAKQAIYPSPAHRVPLWLTVPDVWRLVGLPSCPCAILREALGPLCLSTQRRETIGQTSFSGLNHRGSGMEPAALERGPCT